ncbi:beta-N-acetylhexosaminidase [Paenibacillus barcinonensis]|uniref:Beta-N-acetylhexosaminidase n=1 Tax=Paenibacillus barcinonensis TaxID=198119 RepID=A0A2V4V8D6_PAEBA|nr:beta-N-acetylhexosaminidase [Paenibacillus barcinonensis]PYE42352.1 beta-N-acetylhexosaminidase [Paenibacillus barcinonensis]QKS58113.1 beta-N-acetylhexosaminidase [Paenibacillus barcinonensis]
MRSLKDTVKQRLGQMSLRDKIGQMLLCGFHGTEPKDEVEKLLRGYPMGGVVYFARNVVSPEQVERLSSGLQDIAQASGNVPLWVAIDQEGGMVARITQGIALMPGQMAIAAAGSRQDAYEAARISGMELRSMGINMNFAPVLDVNNNANNPVIGVRSFGESPEAVAEFGAATIAGFQNAGIAATAKHFPGHGDTDTDSHLDLPVITHDRARVDQVELAPFRAAVAEGTDAMMSAHIYFPALEPERLPVTLSHAVLTGLLRKELGYEGMIVTDCMEMNAIAVHYGTVDAAVLAVEAGADMVLISHTAELQMQAFEALMGAVDSGRISERRINESVKRLLTYKAKRGLLEMESSAVPVRQSGNAAELHSDEEQRSVMERVLDMEPVPVTEHRSTSASASALFRRNDPMHHEVARRISEKSITLVRDTRDMLPLKKERTLVITVAAEVTSIADEQLDGVATLGAALSAQGLDVVDLMVAADEIAISSARLLQAAEAEDVKQIVVGTYNAGSPSGDPQCRLIGWVRQLGKPLAVVALRSPYDLQKLPDVQTYIAAYESRPLAMSSVAKAMMGHIPFEGKLPVSLEVV